MNSRILRVIISLLLINLSINTFAQKGKTPQNPLINTAVSTDTCEVTCNLFGANIENLITTENLNFEAPVESPSCENHPSNFEPGCLLSYHNQKWLLVKVVSGKDLNFTITNSANTDIDAAFWGPLAENDVKKACDVLTDFPVSCDYSAGNPQLSLDSVSSGQYYILLVSNFDNLETTIQLKQPTGGEVKYIYLCPSDIVLNSPITGNQNQYAVKSVSLSSGVSDSSSFVAHSGNSISLLPGFSTSESVIFEAEIQACLNTTESYVPEGSEIVCEDFSNHTGTIPHLYANKKQNELIGTVFAKTQPFYSSDRETWKPMVKIGKDEEGDRYWWAYREPYEDWVFMKLRSAKECPYYSDTRATYPFSYIGEEDSSPHTLHDTTFTSFDINSPFHISTDIADHRPNYDVYTMYLRPGLHQLMYRINEKSWRGNTEEHEIYEEYNDRYVSVTKINGFTAPKDFYIDFTLDGGDTFDRYYVTRNSAGGHFSVTSTFTRVEDSTVRVHTYQGDINVSMKLGETVSNEIFGNCFNLGQLPVGDYHMPLTSLKGEYTLDEDVLVRVRK
ncbi:3-coathanger stack domain-containing protein [Jiulongibacter sp. NS-SX5]|uniref:3-coathanger stack domain-containing protein n=1 Tax=Jiulongibacter sp. NS-SX5 TaxID=3463854 RepID=UPI00405846E3